MAAVQRNLSVNLLFNRRTDFAPRRSGRKKTEVFCEALQKLAEGYFVPIAACGDVRTFKRECALLGSDANID